MKYLSCAAVILAMCLIPVIVSAQAEPQEGGTFTFALANDAVFTDYIDGDDHSSLIMYQLIYDQLIQYDPYTGLPAPEIATSWEWSNDALTLTLHLQKGIKFHNGEDLKADDVVYSFERILDEANASPMRGKFAEWMDGIEAIDDSTIEIHHKFPFIASFIYITEVHIVPKDLIEEIGRDAFSQHPAGSGPFKFVEWIKGERYVLERNEDYWMKKPYIDKVIMRPIPELSVQGLEIETGGIDLVREMTPADYSRLKVSNDVAVHTTLGSAYNYIAFNLARPPFNDIRFRQAVYHSVDMDGAIKAVFPGETAARGYGLLPENMWASDYEYLKENIALKPDLEKAKSLFAELVADGVMTRDQKITIWSANSDVVKSLGTILATSMKQAGFNAVAQPTEWGTFIPVLLRSGNPLGDWDIMILGWTGILDPDNFMYTLFHSSNAVPGTTSNLALYSNPAVDVLLDGARREADQAKREELYVQAQRIILSSYVHIPAYFRLMTYGVSPRVQGFVLDPLDFVGLCNQWANVWLK